MSLIRRISASITSSVDRAVSKVENHDAIINAALRDSQRAAVRSRVRLERVRKDGASLKARAETLETAAARWEERAKRIGTDNEQQALECLRRRRDCETQLTKLRQSIKSHAELEERIGAQVQKIEARIGEVAQQRNIMRSRQSVAEAMNAMHAIEGSAGGDIEDAFDRWEINLGESEILYTAATTTTTDELETTFMAEEECAELRAELDALLAADGTGAS